MTFLMKCHQKLIGGHAHKTTQFDIDYKLHILYTTQILYKTAGSLCKPKYQCLKWTVAQSPNATNILFGQPKAAPN